MVANVLRPYKKFIGGSLAILIILGVAVLANSAQTGAQEDGRTVGLKIASENGALEVSGAPWFDIKDSILENLGNVSLFGGLEIVGAGSRFPNGLSVDSTAPNAGQLRGTTFTSTGTSTVEGFDYHPKQVAATTNSTKGVLCNIENPVGATSTTAAIWFDITTATDTVIDLIVATTTDGTAAAAGYVKTTQTDTILTFSIAASAKTFFRYDLASGIAETLGIGADGSTTTARTSVLNPAGSVVFYATTSPTAGVNDVAPAGIGGNFAATCGIEQAGL